MTRVASWQYTRKAPQMKQNQSHLELTVLRHIVCLYPNSSGLINNCIFCLGNMLATGFLVNYAMFFRARAIVASISAS